MEQHRERGHCLWKAAAAAAKSLQSCPTLCDPTDGSPPGSPFPGIFQARTLEWVAISFSNAWKWKGKVKSCSHDRLFATPWTAAYQAPPFMGFSRQEYWSGVPLPSHPKASSLSLLRTSSSPGRPKIKMFQPLSTPNALSLPVTSSVSLFWSCAPIPWASQILRCFSPTSLPSFLPNDKQV